MNVVISKEAISVSSKIVEKKNSLSFKWIKVMHLFYENHISSSLQIDRCECCDIVHETGSSKADIKYRECKEDEIIAWLIHQVII